MQVSARNTLKGTVKKIVPGAINTEVMLEIVPGIEVVAIITKSSAQGLALAVGMPVYAVIKSTDVMVAVD